MTAIRRSRSSSETLAARENGGRDGISLRPGRRIVLALETRDAGGIPAFAVSRRSTRARPAGSQLRCEPQQDADYKAAYDALGEEFDLARALIAARTAAGLSQAQLARRMNTSQSCIARVEGGKVRPSTDALERFAQATRTRLRIVFEPETAR